MPKSRSWSIVAVAVGLCLLLSLSVMAQSEAVDEPILPELDGLAWYRSVDLSGPEIQSTLSEDEVAAWATTLDAADASFDQLEYTFQTAFDPSTLPGIGGLATVRVTGADTDLLREAVVGDVVAQIVDTGGEAPEPVETTIGDKEVTVISLPDTFGFETATVYANEDVAWVMLLPLDLVTVALEQLP